jgi:hypothetical protein
MCILDMLLLAVLSLLSPFNQHIFCSVVVVVDPNVPAKVPIHPAPPLIWGRDGWAPFSGSRDCVVAICNGVNSRDISTTSRRRCFFAVSAALPIIIICGCLVQATMN